MDRPSTARFAPALAFALALGCTAPAAAKPAKPIPVPTPAQWSAYWNQGKAELTSYDLDQARYGELHPGHAVLVFVTEPFSRSKQVKLDSPGGRDEVQVLKLNHTRKFNTGVYPYSIMRSVFTPVDGSSGTIKVSSSTQEWCGHVYMQLNLRNGGGYDGRLFSYFESEGDRALDVPKGTVLEDDVWTLIRIDPNRLPLGNVSMLPNSTYLRLRHVPVTPRSAQATLTETKGGYAYEVKYTDIDRTLRIEFEAAFPWRITSWNETQPTGWGFSKRSLTTRATKKKEIMTDYWSKNRRADAKLRKALGLDE